VTDTGICEVIITGPEGPLLPELGHELVAARLAASANVWTGPVESTYWWRGTIETATETRMHLLTHTDLIDRLVKFVRERHPYDVPSISATPVVAGNPDFIAWVKSEAQPDAPHTPEVS
jgi:periplasmic divalent cation tolerance protein